MLYRKNNKNNNDISLLAFGCMRLPSNFGDAERLVVNAVKAGVNYFDTAYIYPGNEALLGLILKKNNLRSHVKIATKLPPYLVNKEKDFDKILKTQLERLKTDYIDYYLIHMLTSASDWERLVVLGAAEWVSEKKKEGRIKNIGFSYHGGTGEYIKVVDAYSWDFSMIQYNYLDEFNQAGVTGLMHAHNKGLPIMIMEPLRGGKLATGLPPEAKKIWDKATPARSPAEWAFRWLYNQPQILTVLSGMNNNAVLAENIRIASETEPNTLSKDELALFKKARELIIKSTKVPCTGCAYCMPCPAGVDIPLCFSTLNDTAIEGKMRTKLQYVIRTHRHNASLCMGCGNCEKRCPQNIKIREELKNVVKELEHGVYKPMKFVIRKVFKQK